MRRAPRYAAAPFRPCPGFGFAFARGLFGGGSRPACSRTLLVFSVPGFTSKARSWLDRGVLVVDQVGEVAESPQALAELLIILFAQRLAFPLQQRLQLFKVHFDALLWP